MLIIGKKVKKQSLHTHCPMRAQALDIFETRSKIVTHSVQGKLTIYYRLIILKASPCKFRFDMLTYLVYLYFS